MALSKSALLWSLVWEDMMDNGVCGADMGNDLSSMLETEELRARVFYSLYMP